MPIIEWHIALKHDWNITTNKHGRLFKRYISPGLWKQIEATFSGSNIEDNWKALFALADLAHDLGLELANELNFPYPVQLENDIRSYLNFIRTASDKK